MVTPLPEDPTLRDLDGLYPLTESELSGSGIGFVELLRVLGRHKTAIIVSSIVGLLLGFAVGIPMTPVYRVRTAIEVLSLNEDFLNMRQSNPVSLNDNSYENSEEMTQAKLLESDSLMTRVLSKLDPELGAPGKTKMATTGWRGRLHLPEEVKLTRRQVLLNELAASMKVRALDRTRVIEVTADSADPQLAATFLNTLDDEFIQQSLEARLATSHHTSDWLTREIDDARNNLKQAEDRLQEYARDSGLIFTDENINVATEKLQQVQQELSAATDDRIAKQARFEMAKNSPPDTIAQVLSDQSLKDIVTRVNDLRRQIADLSAVYNPEYTRLKRAQAELTVMESAFEQTRSSILARIENDYRESLSREKLLAGVFDTQIRNVTGQNEKAVQYNILKREVDSGRQLYDTMLQQTKQSAISAGLRSSNLRVVDPAMVPERPYSPRFRMNSAIGFAAGLFLSIIFVSVRERADRTFQQPGDIRLWTGLPELGTIPNADFKKIYGRASANGSSARPPEDGSLSLGASSLRSSIELMTWLQKSGLVAESFRSTLASIIFTSEPGSGPRILVVTSVHPSDGKTTAVCNLAIAAAEINQKVLIIDADLRRPAIHNVFSVQQDRGLSDILREGIAPEEGAKLIQQTEIPHLHVLTAGKAAHDAVHLLYSRKFAPLLARLKQEYDIILLDSPPMLQMTDARVAGRLADAVILVARAGNTTRDAVIAARERLKSDNIKVLGTILNAWDPRRYRGAYYVFYEDNNYNNGGA